MFENFIGRKLEELIAQPHIFPFVRCLIATFSTLTDLKNHDNRRTETLSIKGVRWGRSESSDNVKLSILCQVHSLRMNACCINIKA